MKRGEQEEREIYEGGKEREIWKRKKVGKREEREMKKK